MRRELTGTRDEERIEIILFDQSVEMHIGKHLSCITAPMTQQSTLEMLQLERLLQQRVLLQVDHAQAQVETSRHVLVVQLELVRGQGLCILEA